jgi:hypothetical protein
VINHLDSNAFNLFAEPVGNALKMLLKDPNPLSLPIPGKLNSMQKIRFGLRALKMLSGKILDMISFLL